MKVIDIAELAANLDGYLHNLQRETIVVTRDGKPCAVFHGVEPDVETAERAHSAEFWTMIERRRKEDTLSWADARERLNSMDN